LPTRRIELSVTGGAADLADLKRAVAHVLAAGTAARR
jgi:hypothetical protein